MGYYEDQEKQINSQYDSEQARRLQQIQAAKQQQLDSLNKQSEEGKKSFFDQKVSADTQNALQAQKMKEAMANIGALRSGDNVTAMSRLNTDRSNTFSSIDKSQNQFLRDISDRINYTNTNALNQENDLRNTLGSERAKALQGARQYAEQLAMQQQQLAAQRQAQAAAQAKATQPTAKDQKTDFFNQFKAYTQSADGNAIARSMLDNNKQDIILEYGSDFYNMLKDFYWTDMGDYYSQSSAKAKGTAMAY